MSADIGTPTVLGSKRKTLRRQNSVPDMLKLGPAKERKANPSGVALSDMVKMTFSDASFAKSITPLLYDMMNPLIMKTIEASVAASVDAAVNSLQTKVVNRMLESNKQKLQESVAEQTRVIEEQKKVIRSQEHLISDQEKAIADQASLLNSKSETIDQLEMQVECLMVELDSAKFDLNDLEQYGRRSSIRFNSYNPSVNSIDEEQLTKSVTHFLNESVLKGGRSLQIRDIERCHVVGKSKSQSRLLLNLPIIRINGVYSQLNPASKEIHRKSLLQKT